MPLGCDYYFNPSNNILSWWDITRKDDRHTLSFSWAVQVSAGTTGACNPNGVPGVPPTEPAARARCLVLAWAGPALVGQDPGPPGAGFGAQSITLIK